MRRSQNRMERIDSTLKIIRFWSGRGAKVHLVPGPEI
jgi:hypothetical protein